MHNAATSVDADDSVVDDDAALIRAAQRDPALFGLLYERYVDRVYAYLHSRTNNDEDAADLTQQVFLQALAGLARYEGSLQSPATVSAAQVLHRAAATIGDVGPNRVVHEISTSHVVGVPLPPGVSHWNDTTFEQWTQVDANGNPVRFDLQRSNPYPGYRGSRIVGDAQGHLWDYDENSQSRRIRQVDANRSRFGNMAARFSRYGGKGERRHARTVQHVDHRHPARRLPSSRSVPLWVLILPGMARRFSERLFSSAGPAT